MPRVRGASFTPAPLIIPSTRPARGKESPHPRKNASQIRGVLGYTDAMSWAVDPRAMFGTHSAVWRRRTSPWVAAVVSPETGGDWYAGVWTTEK